MDTRDYLTGFAVVASFASLWVSFRTARYNARVKAVELKTDLLLKVASLLRRAEATLEEIRECRSIVSRPGLERFLAVLVPDGPLLEIISRLRKYRDDQEAKSGGISLEDYERMFTVVADCDEKMEEVRVRQSKAKTKLIADLAEIDAQRKSA